MTDQDCVQLLKWSLPRLRMRWNGFRKVRGQVCKRIERRLRQLGLADARSYRSFLEANSDEWEMFDSLCRVTISRFYRDRRIFELLEREVVVRLAEAATAQADRELRCWSIGCASGEEPYSLALLWNLSAGRRFPSLKVTIVGTDADAFMIERAKEACYGHASLRELPEGWKKAFIRREDRFCIRAEEREKVIFLQQDLRGAEPPGLFHLILCRNVAFTYFARELQKEILARLRLKLHDRGALVIGTHESLPPDTSGFAPWPGCTAVFRKN